MYEYCYNNIDYSYLEMIRDIDNYIEDLIDVENYYSNIKIFVEDNRK